MAEIYNLQCLQPVGSPTTALLYTQGVEGGTTVHTGGVEGDTTVHTGGRGWHYCTHRGVEGDTTVHTG